MKSTFKVFLLLLLLVMAALLGRPSVAHAQAIYNGPGTDLTVTDSVLYVNGTVENAGNLLLLGGRLYLDNGDLLNTGDIRAKLGALVLAGTAPAALTLANDTLTHLRIDNTGGVTMTSGGLVRGGLRMAAGHLSTTMAFAMRLLPTASLLGETDAHYIKGTLAQARNLSGSAPIDFSGMGFVVNPQGQTLGVDVERRSGMNQLNYSFGQNPDVPGNQGIDRIWRVSSPGPAPATPVTLSLSWLPANDNGNDFGAAMGQVWRSTDNGASWQRQGVRQSAGGRSITVSTTVLNAWYTVSATPRPLPVELLAFAATAQGLDAALAWTTVSERNSAYFAVERSDNGQRWEEISRQDAAGTSTAPRRYEARDPAAGRRADLLYYRLRQVDLDGTTAYSPVRPVRFAREAFGFALTAYPVPLQALLTLDVRCPGPEPLVVDLYDAVGRALLHQEWPAPAATARYQLDVQKLPSGSYVLHARQGKATISRKLLKE